MPIIFFLLLAAGAVGAGIGMGLNATPAQVLTSSEMVFSPQTTERSLKLGTFGFITPTETIAPSPGPAAAASSIVECGYPYTAGGNARTAISPRENEVLRAFSPQIAHAGDKIIVWYSDEHNLSLGKKKTGFPFTDMTKFPSDHVENPAIGDPNGIDSQGRPIFPAMFITDITTDPSSKIGDWQYSIDNSGAIPLHAIYGSWKATGENDSANNIVNGVWDLAGLQTPPPNTSSEEYGAGAVWYVDRLVASGKMTSGHTYRIQFMVHDGDQTNTGGDEGEGCATVQL